MSSGRPTLQGFHSHPPCVLPAPNSMPDPAATQPRPFFQTHAQAESPTPARAVARALGLLEVYSRQGFKIANSNTLQHCSRVLRVSAWVVVLGRRGSVEPEMPLVDPGQTAPPMNQSSSTKVQFHSIYAETGPTSLRSNCVNNAYFWAHRLNIAILRA